MADVALITGASSGLGTELARLFASHERDLVLVARRRERLESLAADLSGRYRVNAHVVVADLSVPGAVSQIVAETDRLGLEVSYLVNNAGFGTKGPFVRLDRARELAELQVDVAAPLALTRAFLPGMVSRGRGRIVNVSSMAGFQPGPFMATYYASKAFLNSFSEALSHELRGTGVTVTVSCSGPMATEFDAVAGGHRTSLKLLLRRSPSRFAGEAYEAMMLGRPMIIHGLANKMGVEALRLAPRSVVRAAAALSNRPHRGAV